VNAQAWNDKVVRDYVGDIYEGFEDADMNGIRLQVDVNKAPIEFTLCMNGVNDRGETSDFVRFQRGESEPYLCRNEGNDGLPCIDTKKQLKQINPIRIDNPISATIKDARAHSSSHRTQILGLVFVAALAVMCGVSCFYAFATSQKGKLGRGMGNNFKKDINWSEINCSSDTTLLEEDDGDSDGILANDPLDPSESEIREKKQSKHDLVPSFSDRSVVSDLSVDGDDNDKVALLKDRLMDDHDDKYARVHVSVCSNISENDETLILPNYNGYHNNKKQQVEQEEDWLLNNVDAVRLQHSA